VIALSLTILAAESVYDALIPEAHAAKTVRCRVPGGLLGAGRTVDCTPVIVGN